ncbi:serine O-acetyltransferase [Alteromonas sp. BMJM2]|uniref:serine O-acetyltransferase n=1 Tax=Alteromonas sp. BMJM2 TaxID=2954241 RepID=UPI0022B37D08|nr:serine O-acetyltransferase [Alteromonas sp. BMJM2]
MNLLKQIKEDWETHGKDWTKPGFRALAYHRFGNWRMKIKPKLLRLPFSFLYRFLYRRARNIYGIEIPYTVKIGRRVVFEHQHGIVIHGNCEIGNGCIIRQGVTLGNKNLRCPHDAPKLGNNVNVGAGAKILGDIRIGNGAQIGANAVVLCNVKENDIATGIVSKKNYKG